MERKKLGQLLVDKSYINDRVLGEALGIQQKQGGRLGQLLIEMGHLKARHLTEALCHQAGIDKAKLDDLNIPQDLLKLIPAELVSKHNVIPISRQNGRITMAMADPFSRQAIEELRMVTGLSIRRVYGTPADMEKAIQKYYGSNVARMLENLAPGEKKQEATDDILLDDQEMTAARLHELAREPSLINLVNLVIFEAIEARASDIHIEPFEKEVKIKYRIDGLLMEKSSSPKRLQAAIISRVKIMAGMDIAERFVPQDGHIEFSSNANKIDLRVSTVPCVFGESITMRILDRSAALINLEDLGMNEHSLKGYNQCLTKSHGIVLVTGPTGSGKTTTLYASLNKIFDPSLKIITIEDPVEYQLDGIIQMPVNPRRGLTFGRGLRHILRQDPNIIMVGEIRDKETADIAIRAALTGHLVFSTLHTNDAPGAITRLIDMGVEPFLLASSLEGVLAQRLVRKICPACKEEYHPSESLLENLNNSIAITDKDVIYHGTGCDECNNSGMRGRIGLYELLKVNDTMRKLIATRPTTEQIKELAEDHVSMRHDGIEKILKGITIPEEVLRVTQGIEED